MLKIFSPLISTLMHMSDHDLLYPFKGPGAVGNGLTGTKDAMVYCLFVFICG